MITLLRLTDTPNTTTWLVEYNGQLKRVTTPHRARKDSLLGMRHAICKATHLNATQFRHIKNERINGAWVSQWISL